MATTKNILYKNTVGILNGFICVSFLGLAWLGLAGARHDSVDTPSSFSCWFFPIAQGWGRGVVKETGICNHRRIYLIFKLLGSPSDVGIFKGSVVMFMKLSSVLG